MMTYKRFITVDADRFYAVCKALGGTTAVSRKIGISDGYIRDRIRHCGCRIRDDIVYSVSKMADIPVDMLKGNGTDYEFQFLLRQSVLRYNRERGIKHSVCNSYCGGCAYECWAAATEGSPPQRFCDYMYQTGKPRGCPAGTGCSKRTVGRGLRRAKVNILISGSHIPFRR